MSVQDGPRSEVDLWCCAKEGKQRVSTADAARLLRLNREGQCLGDRRTVWRRHSLCTLNEGKGTTFP
jgi:hypothetical protein